MFDFSTEVDRHGTGAPNGIMSPTGLARPTCYHSPSQIWILPPHHAFSSADAAPVTRCVGLQSLENDDFLAAISHWFLTRHNTQIDPQSVVYGPSVIYMVSELIRQWSSTGDAVVIHTPAYDAFYNAIKGNQRTVHPVALEKRAHGWYCDMAKLEETLSRPESKILLLCSPQNPTGKVWTRDELETMASMCQRHGVKVISDEIHMDMVWDQQPHIPWSQVARGDWALLTSGSKSFNIPALTGAYGIVEDADSRNHYLAALKGRDGLSSPAVLALTAHIAAYQHGAPWLDALRDYLAANLHYVAHELNAAFPELNWQIPQSTYLAWIDLRPLNIDDHALQDVLIHQQKVAIMPGYTYGEEGRGFVRLNAGCPRAKLEKGVNGLINAIRSLR